MTNFTIFICVVSLIILGAFFGLILGWASKFFEIKQKINPKIAEIDEILPQLQCGTCGQAGCFGFAEAVVRGDASPDDCRPGGDNVARKIGIILGIEVESSISRVATVLCTRNNNVQKIKDYQGIQDCRAARTLGMNIYACSSACLGLGTCVSVCPCNGIFLNENQMPVVREDVCTGCGKCVSECPVQVLRLTPKYNNVHVLCVSNDLGKNKIKAHRSGACIACGKCVQACPNQAISIENNVASIDYYKCTNCEECIAVCPTKAISNIRPITEKV